MNARPGIISPAGLRWIAQGDQGRDQRHEVGAGKGEWAHWGWVKEMRDKRAHIAPRLGCWFSCIFSFSQQCSAPSGNVCRPCFSLLLLPFSHIGGSDGARE